MRRPLLLLLAAVLLAFALWLFSPGPNQFRSFDPVALGGAETDLWRDYYERKHVELAREIILTEHDDFGLSPWISLRSGFAAADAARIFQASHSRAEAQAALPALTEHFRLLNDATNADIDPARAAQLELEWWQLRREHVGPNGYEPAVAEAAAYLYGVAPERLGAYAHLRVEAMELRDRKGRAITDADWRQIRSLLIDAYSELRVAVS
ncbi:MAG TPA: hypothetical protein VG943_08620 [Caulobacterales bacterium]|nr:hypothetical protein [Caulobacterales bacterium]